MQLKKRNKVIWMIGCVHYIISLGNALPTVQTAPQNQETDSGVAFHTHQPVAVPTTAGDTNNVFSLANNSEDSISNIETAGSIVVSTVNLPASNEASKSGTDDGSSLPLNSFNTMVPNVMPPLKTATQGNVGTGTPSIPIFNTNLNQQPSFSDGQLGTKGFLATVTRPASSPSQIPGRVMFSQRNMNMIPRPTGPVTVVGPPTRRSSTFRTFGNTPGITLKFVKPISSLSLIPIFTPARNSLLPPTNFHTSFYSTPKQTFPIIPFVRSEFPSDPFPSPSVNTPQVPSISPPMPRQQPPSVTFPPATFVGRLSPLSSPATVSFPPLVSRSIGSSVPSNMVSSAPAQPISSFRTVDSAPSTTILNNNIPLNPPANPHSTIPIQSPPPPAQVTSFQPLPLMGSQSQISRTPFNLGSTSMSVPTSIPVSFAQLPTVFPLMPTKPGSSFAAFSSPRSPVTTNMIGVGMSPPPFIQQAGGFIPRAGSGGAGGRVTAVGGSAPGTGMFQADRPPAQPTSLMTSFNEFLSPLARAFQSI